MAQVIYKGSFNGARGIDGASITLKGTALPANATLKSITYKLEVSTPDTYSSSQSWVLSSMFVNGGRPYAPQASYTMYSAEHTFAGGMAFSAADVAQFTTGSFELYACAYTTHTGTISRMYDVEITVEYVILTSCGAPTKITVDANAVEPGTTTTLRWSGATSGTGGTIKGYWVYRSMEEEGEVGNGYNRLAVIDSTATSGSLEVKAPSTASETYYYRIVTVATVSGYNSPLSEASAYVRSNLGPAFPPTTVKVSATGVAPGANVTLSWSGAAPGNGNAIAGYRILRATSADGTYTRHKTVESTVSYGHTTVKAPTTEGASYFYKVKTLGASGNETYHSDPSEVYAELYADYATMSAPTTIRVDMTNVAPGAEATLSWSGAAAGENNAISGYWVYQSETRDGEVGTEYQRIATIYATETAGSYTVTAPTKNGAAYYYRIVTVGTLSGYNSPLSDTVASLTCTYSAPTAPSRLTLNGAPEAYSYPGAEVTLAWSGATNGVNNPITGYEVYRDGVLFASDISSAQTSLSVPVADEAGEKYAYSVKAVGTHYGQTSPHSESCFVYTYSDPTPPKVLEVSSPAAPAGQRVVLSWNGATAGGNNAIVGYRVYRADSADGEYTVLLSQDNTDTSGACTVTAPSHAGAVYSYRVETVSVLSSSGMSSAYAALTATDATSEDSRVTVDIATKVRARRGMILGDYDTAQRGPWTLASWNLTTPMPLVNYIPVPGRRRGPIDASTAMTGGESVFDNRSLSARFECSEWTRLERDAVLSEMVNELHGQQVNIFLPDDTEHYLIGRVQIQPEYSDEAHAAVALTATCEPWLYNATETVVDLLADDTVREVVLLNSGRMIAVPTISVPALGAESVTLSVGALSWTLTPGEYTLPELQLRTGATVLSYVGKGEIHITYREAVL